MDVLTTLDLKYRSNFFHNDDVAYEDEFASGYSFLSEDLIFEGRAVDLSASICEGLVRELGFHSSDVWLGHGVDRHGKEVYAALCRSSGAIYELGVLGHGAYINAFGMPHTKPREVSLSNVKYERMYRFDELKWITVAEDGWPLEPTPTVLETFDGFTLPDGVPIKKEVQYQVPIRGEKEAFSEGPTIMDRIKTFFTQPFAILGVAVLFILCTFALPEFWDFMLGGSLLLIARSFVTVSLLLAGVWLCRRARALFKDGGINGEAKNMGGYVYVAVAICILAASIGQQ